MQDNQTPVVQTTDSLQQPVQTEATVVQAIDQKPKTNSFLVGLLSVLLFLSVAIAGFFAYQTQNLAKELTLLKSVSTPTSEAVIQPTQIPVATTDPTADWKTFEVDDKRISFKYPQTWYTQPLVFQGRVVGITSLLLTSHEYGMEPSSVNIQYWKNPNKLSLEQFQSEIDAEGGRIYNLYKPAEQPVTAVKIGGVDGYYSPRSDCEPFSCASYVVNTEDRIYEIKIFPTSMKYKEDVDQILSTFKFTN